MLSRKQMGALFISYRRGDSEGQARALSIALREYIGRDSVFMDVDSIALGRDFRQVLQERLESCDVMLALIGPRWLDIEDAAGKHRLENPADVVRQEIAAALKRNIPVTPVLVQGAQMPEQERLPDDIKDLAFRNGFELSHTRWDSDVRELVERLGLGKTAVPAAPQERPRVKTEQPAPVANTNDTDASRRRVWIVSLAVLIVLIVAGFLWFQPGTGVSQTDTQLANRETPKAPEDSKAVSSPPADSKATAGAVATPTDTQPATVGTPPAQQVSTNSEKASNTPAKASNATPPGIRSQSGFTVVFGELTWTTRDSASSFSWDTANKYCNDLDWDGLSHWRMPTIDELASLYDPKRADYNKIREPIRLDSSWVWSSTKRGSNRAVVFSFASGLRDNIELEYSNRALCVRRSGE
jgi:hypothetical protein